MSALQKKADVAWHILSISFWLYIAVLTVTTWWLHQEGQQPSVAIWLIRIGPLLLFAPAVWRRSLRGMAWLCFVCLMYFMVAVTYVMSPLRLWINDIELILSITIFVSAMMTIRWQAQASRQGGEHL